MKVRIKRWAVLFMVMLGTVFSTSMSAFAYTENAEQQTAETEVSEETESTEETDVLEENQSESEATPFSIPGNGQLLDDKSEDGTKQFLTIQTKSGNTFFMVLDRSSNTENVYMLSMIDENDLAEFVSETSEPAAEIPAVVLPEQETKPVTTDTESEVESEPEAGGMSTGAILAIILIIVGGIGGYYYFKIVKPKKDEEEAEDEDLEFYDGGAYINEDQDDSDEETDDSLEDEE
ncbi:CD1107 family mobile element protein [Lacrimispora xylanisolvens]|uniref:CD1107 family mobile element protein n=1 Tax=Lacrimispora xylanisolvens TaxID=384636 RepID=UPI002402D4B3